jgi:hypothetical protein
VQSRCPLRPKAHFNNDNNSCNDVGSVIRRSGGVLIEPTHRQLSPSLSSHSSDRSPCEFHRCPRLYLRPGVRLCFSGCVRLRGAEDQFARASEERAKMKRMIRPACRPAEERKMERERFVKLVDEVLDALPTKFRKRIQNVAILVENVASRAAPTRRLAKYRDHEFGRCREFGARSLRRCTNN